MTTLALPRISVCRSCRNPIAAETTRNRGQIVSAWVSVSGSTLCSASPSLVHAPGGAS